MILRIHLLCLCLLLIFSCHKKHENHEAKIPVGKTFEVKYAKGFSIEESSSGMTVKLLNPFQDSEDTISLFFRVDDNSSISDNSEIIQSLPINKVALMASTYAAFFEELGEISMVKAISSRNYFYSNKIQKGVDENSILEIGYGQNIDFEKTLIVDPELIIISGVTSADLNNYAKLKEAGISILPISEWREEHPLARAEWIKVFGVITGKLEEATRIFNNIEQEYNDLKSLVSDVENQPKVLVNAPYKDIWWLPGGKSYVSMLLKDAKADYPWKNDSNTGGIQSDLEAVYYQAGEADVWINTSGFTTLKALKDVDGRFTEFKAFKEKNVYNNNLRMGEHGGNDYFESGIIKPNIILKDLIKIFHPELISDHNLYFYQKLD